MPTQDASPPLSQQLAEAFNRRDLDAMAALLAPKATAKVLGSEMPTEEGPTTIRDTSLNYLLREEEGSLQAEACAHEGTDYVLVRSGKGERPLDCAMRVLSAEGQITRIEYLVLWFREAELKQLAADLSLPLATVDPT